MTGITVSGAAVDFGAQSVLQGVDLSVAEGEFVTLLGPSGVGKSTLLHAIVGLLEPHAGQIQLDGECLSAPRRLGRVGFMAQRDGLLPWLRLAQNVGLALSLQGVPPREIAGRLRPLLKEFGLAGFERRYPAELSGGMRQRAALLRTLLGGQRLIALDEPFGALDSITRARLWEWLAQRLDAHPRTVLLVTHDIDEALFLSDRILILRGSPARIAASLRVPLARPRRLTDLASHAAADVKGMLLGELGGDAA